MNRNVVLDARAVLGERSLALCPVLGRAWIVTYLDMISDAKALDRLSIVTGPLFKDAIQHELSAYKGAENIPVQTEMPKSGDWLLVEIHRVYVRRQFIRAVLKGERQISTAPVPPIESADNLKAAEEFTYKDAPGHRTPLLRYVYRPASRRMAGWLSKTPVTPNGVTLVALTLVPTTAVLIVADNYAMAVIAAILLQVFMIVDLIDGDLARLTGRMSPFGYWFDSMVDFIFELTIAAAFGVGAVLATGNGWFALPTVIWIVALATIYNSNLLESISRQGAPVYETRPEPILMGSKSARRRILGMLRRAIRAFGQPEITRLIQGVGLVIALEAGIVLLYSLYFLYSITRMFARAYTEHRRNSGNGQFGKEPSD